MTNPLRVGLRQERVIAPQCLVIFGQAGPHPSQARPSLIRTVPAETIAKRIRSSGMRPSALER